ncbi:MAG: NAD(P)-binding domain-containing protein [Myxococcota bacterium]
MSSLPPVSVLGGGAFGRGIALAAARNGRDVLLWSRSAREIDHPNVRTTTELSDARASELAFVAVPSPFVARVAEQLAPHLDGRHYLVHVSRGLIGEELTPITRVLRQMTPAHRVGALAGPLAVSALSGGTPSGAIVGTRFPEVTDAVRDAIGSSALRVYATKDVVGVEVASAMVGLLALTVGYAQGMNVSGAALSVFLTRAMAEAVRLSPTLGVADPQTLYGLAGFGDLIAVVAGDERPEVLLGRALAGGTSLEDAGKAAGAHIEGVSIARRLAAHAERLRLNAPITQAIVEVLEGGSASDAYQALMARRVGSE